MNSEDIKAIAHAAAEEAAEKAVRQTFRMFGVDTLDQDSVNEFRSDLVFARELRKTTRGVKSKILMVVIGLIITAAFAAMVKGLGFSNAQ